MAVERLSENFIKWLANEAGQQLSYLFNYKRYDDNFDTKQKELAALVETVEQKIKDAKKRNKTEVEPRVKNWLKHAEQLSKRDAEPTKCFGLFKNSFLNMKIGPKRSKTRSLI